MSQPDTFDRVIRQVLAGGDVAILAPDGGADALLDKATRRLAIQDSRVFRLKATVSEGLSIARLVAEVTGRLERTQQDDLILREAFGNLTVLDESYDRIVLLISGADALPRSTLRYLQLAIRVGPALQFVLAGTPGFLAALDTDEFAPLHSRLAAQEAVDLGAAAPAAAQPPAPPRPVPLVPAPGTANPATGPAPMRRVRAGRGAVIAAGLGLAVACVALGGWLLRQGPVPDGRQAVAVLANPAPPVLATPPAPEPQAIEPQAPEPQALAGTRAEPPRASAALPEAAVEPPLPAVPLPAVPVRKPESAEPRGVMTRLESLYAELEASRRQASRRAARKAARAPTPDQVLVQPESPRAPQAAPPDVLPDAVAQKPERFLGTYSTDANGVRSYKANEP